MFCQNITAITQFRASPPARSYARTLLFSCLLAEEVLSSVHPKTFRRTTFSDWSSGPICTCISDPQLEKCNRHNDASLWVRPITQQLQFGSSHATPSSYIQSCLGWWRRVRFFVITLHAPHSRALRGCVYSSHFLRSHTIYSNNHFYPF